MLAISLFFKRFIDGFIGAPQGRGKIAAITVEPKTNMLVVVYDKHGVKDTDICVVGLTFAEFIVKGDAISISNGGEMVVLFPPLKTQ